MSAVTTLIGNATADVELRYSQNGKPIGSVTIAVSDRVRNKSTNEWEDGKTWFARCTIWGETAEHAAATITKGQRVIAQGRIEQRDWEDKDGNKRTSVEVTVDEIGPSLRYATAQVTRAQSSRDEIRTSPQAEEPWAVTQPASGDDWDQTGMADAWNPPRSGYTDETPF